MRNEPWKNPLAALHSIYKDLIALPGTVLNLAPAFGAKAAEHAGKLKKAPSVAARFTQITSKFADVLGAAQPTPALAYANPTRANNVTRGRFNTNQLNS